MHGCNLNVLCSTERAEYKVGQILVMQVTDWREAVNRACQQHLGGTRQLRLQALHMALEHGFSVAVLRPAPCTLWSAGGSGSSGGGGGGGGSGSGSSMLLTAMESAVTGTPGQHPALTLGLINTLCSLLHANITAKLQNCASISLTRRQRVAATSQHPWSTKCVAHLHQGIWQAVQLRLQS
jgi:hypothetical protein